MLVCLLSLDLVSWPCSLSFLPVENWGEFVDGQFIIILRVGAVRFSAFYILKLKIWKSRLLVNLEIRNAYLELKVVNS